VGACSSSKQPWPSRVTMRAVAEAAAAAAAAGLNSYVVLVLMAVYMCTQRGAAKSGSRQWCLR
jgi:hypothetical protein